MKIHASEVRQFTPLNAVAGQGSAFKAFSTNHCFDNGTTGYGGSFRKPRDTLLDSRLHVDRAAGGFFVAIIAFWR